ncbi:MAG TPA: hypothetical protein VKB88_20390 [Bryobacteraceae bacterium]|nr:hypothetical protein [Bryobacteraceae bacterium]
MKERSGLVADAARLSAAEQQAGGGNAAAGERSIEYVVGSQFSLDSQVLQNTKRLIRASMRSAQTVWPGYLPKASGIAAATVNG